MVKNNVVYSAKRQYLRLGSRKYGIVVRESKWYEQDSSKTVRDRVAHATINYVKLASHDEFRQLITKTQGSRDRVIQ